MPMIRPAAVAGQFYPREAQALQAVLDGFLAPPGGAHETTAIRGQPKLLIVPHAGYIYSGAVAGHAYARLRPHAAAIRRVVLLGPAHRVALRGLALPAAQAFQTPLGSVVVDAGARAALADLPQVLTSDAVHADEHALEVQLPFLQQVLGEGFTLVPLAVGQADAEDVAEVLERLWGRDETLIVISSDLSHYHPYAEAQAIDAGIAARIAARATDLRPAEACGAHAQHRARLAAQRHGLQPVLLNLRNSGDPAGDRGRVGGYAAFAADGPAAPALTDDEQTGADDDDASFGAAAVARARRRIAAALGLPAGPAPAHPGLHAAGASFVTLRDAKGALRGCIGRLEAERPLADDVAHNAHAAAFQDSRFAPLHVTEWTGLQIEVSVLSTAEALPPADRAADALRQLRPGVDGVILAWRGRRATFLPQVWDELPRPEEFFAALWRKAGLPAGFWAEDLQLSRYTVRHFQGPAVEEGAAS